jgi:hypothetical protein
MSTTCSAIFDGKRQSYLTRVRGTFLNAAPQMTQLSFDAVVFAMRTSFSQQSAHLGVQSHMAQRRACAPHRGQYESPEYFACLVDVRGIIVDCLLINRCISIVKQAMLASPVLHFALILIAKRSKK